MSILSSLFSLVLSGEATANPEKYPTLPATIGARMAKDSISDQKRWTET